MPDFYKLISDNKFNKVNFTLNEIPWKFILWNPTEKTMVMGNQGLVKLLFIYIYNPILLRQGELTSLKTKYADKLNYEGDEIENILQTIPKIN